VVGWASPALKAELQRIAELNGLSVSATIVSLLEQAVQQSLHDQHAALLQPLVEQAVRREMRTLANRLASLLVAILFAVFQIRQLLINALVRLPSDRQMSEAVLNTIRDKSAERARQELRQRSPQLATLIKEEYAQWN
jgi:hypothetical protein